MKTKLTLLLLFTSLAGALPAAVSLQFAGPASVDVRPGDSFNVTLNVLSDGGETITGLDYYFNTNLAGSGLLSITGRDFTGSTFDFLNYNNATVLGAASALLDPRNNHDLGGGTTTLDGVSGSTSYFVATYTIHLSTSAVAGETYSLFTDSITAFTGWVSEGPSFEDNPFASQAFLSINVTAVPEPATYSVMFGAAALMSACAGRRRKAKG